MRRSRDRGALLRGALTNVTHKFHVCSFQGTYLTEPLSVIRNLKLCSKPLITGKTSLSQQLFPADTG